MFGREFAGLTDRPIGTFARIGVNNIGAISGKNLFALNRNVGRHTKRNGKTLSRTEHGVSNAGVSAGGVEQDFPRTELAFVTALRDDVRSCAVFYRAARIM